MKRITDYMADPLEALSNSAMVSYVSEAKTEKMKDGRTAMAATSLSNRITLDITDLLPYINRSATTRLGKIEGCIPPWRDTLVEYEVQPGTIIGNAIQARIASKVTRCGYLITRLNVDQLCKLYESSQIDEHFVGTTFNKIEDASYTPEERYRILAQSGMYSRHMTPEEIEDIGWYLICFPFFIIAGDLYGPSAETHVVLTKNGRVVSFPTSENDEVIRHTEQGLISVDEPGAPGLALWNEWAHLSPYAQKSSEKEQRRLRLNATTFAAATILPVLFAFSLANYTNIHPRPMDPTKEHRSRQMQRDLERRNQVPLEKYHVLEIGSIGKGRRERVLLSTRLNSMPLHVARGCWHHYGPEYGRGLLFGKYAGKFWVDAHMRGSKNVGVVTKDYDLTKERVESVRELTHGNN